MRCTRMAFVDPGIPGGLPATIVTRSPIEHRSELQQACLNLPHHVIGMCDRVDEITLDTPRQGQLMLHLWVRSEAPATEPSSDIAQALSACCRFR